MRRHEFDAAGLFDDDYLYFYADRLDDEHSETDTDLVWRLLDLEPGMEVLDLACGHGRLAERLAGRGCRVTGLDASERFLEVARRSAAERGMDVTYVHGDMRALPWTERFDRVVNWFSAYGYFPDDENRQVLHEVRRALRPGGKAVFDMIAQANLLRRMLPDVVTRRGDDLLVDRHTYDAATGRMAVERIVVRDGSVRGVPYFVRLLGFPEFRDWLLDAGFTSVEVHGDDGGPFGLDSARMDTVATR